MSCSSSVKVGLSYWQAGVWRCGDKTRCPTIPTPDGNPWDIRLGPLIQKDLQRCEAWRDEIQNLLIFSGLFSAVVTAFVVQTYQGLQPSPQDYIPTLLAQLVQLQRNHTEWPLEMFSPPNSDLPSGSAIRTHIYWFSSLVLSLIVVLVGTVSLQWLREFQRYPPTMSSKKPFAARSLRAESFERWHVPQIMASLPLLLQLAVVLFFLGLMDALLQTNVIIALPVIVLGGLAMCFQAITTMLPTLQSFWLICAMSFSEPPLHCPYKSPQSWAFLRFMTSAIVRAFTKWLGITIQYICFIPFPAVSMLSRILNVHGVLWRFIDRITARLHPRYLGTVSNWDDFDDLWLGERYRFATASPRPSHNVLHKGTEGTDYDAARGIARIMSSPVLGEPLTMAIYHCFQGLDPAIVTDELLRLVTQGTTSQLWADEGVRQGSHIIPFSTPMVKEENEMFLLNRLSQINNYTSPLHVFHLRQLELFVRTTAHIFVDLLKENSSDVIIHHNSSPAPPSCKNEAYYRSTLCPITSSQCRSYEVNSA
ncbi:hypothetical protein BJ165DRAFT_147143 [Panaeolus papilionaceus]|nr:hypothetical protein BJ165DRAFT_147143 [Panaeolus papilionaceus]